MNIIETRNLYFRYHKTVILNNINLEIPQGSIYGYLGRNGAGKSTTLKILLGLLPIPDHTVLYWKNKDINSNSSEILKSVGSLIEAPAYYPHLTAYEHLKYLDLIYRCGEKRIAQTLKIVGLNAEKKIVKHFSTGMKQRLGIGMAIFHNPEILILDEPMNGLDPQGIHEIRELLLKLKEEGKTILLSSHVLGEIERVCSHIGILEKGELLYQGSLKTLMDNNPDQKDLESIYLNYTTKK